MNELNKDLNNAIHEFNAVGESIANELGEKFENAIPDDNSSYKFDKEKVDYDEEIA